MFEYKYVEAHLEGFFQKQDYIELITHHAKSGWRYHSYIPKGQNSDGRVYSITLVFEREKDSYPTMERL